MFSSYYRFDMGKKWEKEYKRLGRMWEIGRKNLQRDELRKKLLEFPLVSNIPERKDREEYCIKKSDITSEPEECSEAKPCHGYTEHH